MHYIVISTVLFSMIVGTVSAATAKPTYIPCSAHDCSFIAPLLGKGEALSDNHYIVYSTKKTPTVFMQRKVATFTPVNSVAKKRYNIIVNEGSLTDASAIIGFGGAITDATSMLYKAMPVQLKKQFINAYYSDSGIEYSLIRVPVSSTDFSCRNASGKPSLSQCDPKKSQYSYDNNAGDLSLKFFKLAPEDTDYKIPLIRDALKKSNESKNKMRLFFSIWSAPSWMKDNKSMVHGSLIHDTRIQGAYANYLIRILDEYKKQGIWFWGMTVQNEPDDPGLIGRQSWQTMYSKPKDQAFFIQNNLGPKLEKFEQSYSANNTPQKLNLIINDDDSIFIEDRTKGILQDQAAGAAKNYVDGIGMHWYTNSIDLKFHSHVNSAWSMLRALKDKPHFMLSTEACNGAMPRSIHKGPILGDWGRGEAYAHDIITTLNSHFSGWVDWNQLLNMQGGPTWANNNVDAPILVDLNKGVFYKQPMYFYMGQFSKFIRPGSRQITLTDKAPLPFLKLETVAYLVPPSQGVGQHIVVVVLNRSNRTIDFNLYDKQRPNSCIPHSLEPHAISTFIFNAMPAKRGSVAN